MKKIRFVLAVVGPVLILASLVELMAWLFPGSVRSLVRSLPTGSSPEPETVAPFDGDLLKAAELVNGPSLVSPIGLAASGNWMVILDPIGEEEVLALDVTTMELAGIKELLAQAESGSRFYQVAPAETPGAFYLNNTNESQFVKLELSAGDPVAVNVRFVDKGPQRVAEYGDDFEKLVTIVGATEGRLISNPLARDAMLLIQRIEDNTLETVRAVGNPLFPNVPGVEPSYSLNRNTIAVCPDDGRIVQAFMFSSRLHTYSSEGTLERMIAGPVDVQLVYETRFEQGHGDYFVTTEDTRYAYMAVTCDVNFIYALFAGRAHGTFDEDASFGSQLHVFSWDGHFVGNWHLPEPIYSLVLAGDPPKLWGFRRTPTPSLIAYELPAARIPRLTQKTIGAIPEGE